MKENLGNMVASHPTVVQKGIYSAPSYNLPLTIIFYSYCTEISKNEICTT